LTLFNEVVFQKKLCTAKQFKDFVFQTNSKIIGSNITNRPKELGYLHRLIDALHIYLGEHQEESENGNGIVAGETGQSSTESETTNTTPTVPVNGKSKLHKKANWQNRSKGRTDVSAPSRIRQNHNHNSNQAPNRPANSNQAPNGPANSNQAVNRQTGDKTRAQPHGDVGRSPQLNTRAYVMVPPSPSPQKPQSHHIAQTKTPQTPNSTGSRSSIANSQITDAHQGIHIIICRK
jgi:hypothetical protein